MSSKPAPAETRTRTPRYGGAEAYAYNVFVTGITADMDDPTALDPTADANEIANLGIFRSSGREVLWEVIVPSWCTSVDVSSYRLVGRVVNDVAVVPMRWVRDDTEAFTESGGLYQYNHGDRMTLRLHNIVGTPDPAEPLIVLSKYVSREA